MNDNFVLSVCVQNPVPCISNFLVYHKPHAQDPVIFKQHQKCALQNMKTL